MDGHQLTAEETAHHRISVREVQGLDVSMVVGQYPRFSLISPKDGTYEVDLDGDYHWKGWNE